jgi:hypothetical protein
MLRRPSFQNVASCLANATEATFRQSRPSELCDRVAPADSTKRRRSDKVAGFMTSSTTSLVLLSMHFGYAACGLAILYFRCDMPFQRLSRFEQISQCGRATNIRAAVNSILRDGRLSTMIAERKKDFSLQYSSWFGKPVVMLVVIRQCPVPMPCRIVGESVADVRVRIQSGWEMEIRKDLILAVEEFVIAAEDRVN